MKQTITPDKQTVQEALQGRTYFVIFISVNMYEARKLLIFCSEIYFTRLIFPITNLKMPNLQQK